jgi:hypothetical protein
MSGRDWNAGGKPAGRWEHSQNSEAQDREIQRGIDATMREVIRNPYRVDFASQAETPKPRGTGWAKENPITSPPGQDIIAALTNQALPHGPGNPLSKVVEEVVERFKTQTQKVAKEPVADGER